MNRAEIVRAVKDVRAADTLDAAVDLAIAHLVRSDDVPKPFRHKPTCASWRCGSEWRTENGAGVCRQPRDSEIHYVGTVDSHAFVERHCDCGAVASAHTVEGTRVKQRAR